MKHMLPFLAIMLLPVAAAAVTYEEDIATTIILKGYDCGGRTVSNVEEEVDAQGNKTIWATCPNGRRYRIEVRNERVTVTPSR